MTSFADHFSGRARDYARYRPDYPRVLFEFLADLAPDGKTAWDCATGSGQAALGLAGRFDAVVATDASIHQISSAAQHHRVHYAVATAEEAPLADGSVALVAAAQALHWFDRERFWEEARRLLVPGGVIAVWSYHGFHITPEVEAVIHHYYKDIVGPYWPPERALVEQGYRTIEFPFEEETVPPLRLEKLWDLAALMGYLRTWSATQRYESDVGQDPLTLIREELLAVWGPPQRIRTFRWDLDLRVGRKVSR
ncbi:MAG TPA: class I SAM-dependent methyltransferase [Thermoanaerobaculia bacterium]